jgi:UDP-N-acetylmuramoyl-L-alanyl-D-glutamate--2,6-diaminopimelate ligase
MNAMLPVNALPLEIILQKLVKAGAKMTGDTRALKAGDVMMAYPVGNQRQLSDNRSFIAEALNKGAAVVLYEPTGLSADLLEICKDERCIAVNDLAAQAGVIASHWYGEPSQAMRVIGVTGTNGKTSVAQWIAQALNQKAQPSAIIGTLGAGLFNQVVPTGFTTPDAPRLQSLLSDIKDGGATSVAMEVSSHALDQGRINGTYLDTAIVTNLSQDHLDYHGDMAEYAAAKKKIFSMPGLKNLIVNADDAFGQTCLRDLGQLLMQQSAPTVWAYGTLPENLLALPCYANTKTGSKFRKVLASHVEATKQGMAFELMIDGENAGYVKTKFIGHFNVSNALAVAATLLAGGMAIKEVKQAIENLQPVKGRMELVSSKSTQVPLAVVDFAHTPDALEKVLKTLKPIAEKRQGQLWCVFGCGGDRDATKRPLMGAIAERYASHVMVTSDNPRSENPQTIIAEILTGFSDRSRALSQIDRAAAILQVVRQAKPEDVILVAGKGHEETQEISGKKTPFSDQVHLQLAMEGSVR